MILPLLLAATLAAATPVPEPAPEPAADPYEAATPAAAERPAPDVPITLRLKDASVVDVLEKFADLLGVTPILDPNVGGRVDVEIANVPASKGLEMVGKAAGLDVTLTTKILRAQPRAGSVPAGGARVPASAPFPAAGPTDALRFWLEGSPERAVAVRIPESVGHVELPGCSGPVTIGAIGRRAGSVLVVALATAGAPGERPTGRILGGGLSDGTRVLLPGCDGRLLVETREPAAGAGVVDPVPIALREPLVVGLRLLEVTEQGEESLAEPVVQLSSGGSFAVSSSHAPRATGDASQLIEIHGVPLAARLEERSLLLAVYASVTRTRAASEGGGTLAARRAESLWLRQGRPTRWTVDSSWNGGRAALVVEATLERIGRPAPR